jgi:hypothetical protein
MTNTTKAEHNPAGYTTGRRRSLDDVNIAGSLNLAYNCPLGVELHGISIVRLLLAVFQASALVVFKQPMLSTIVSIAKRTVTDYSLCSVRAVLKSACLLLGSAATQP